MAARRNFLGGLGVLLVLGALIAGQERESAGRATGGDQADPAAEWREVAPGVLRSSGTPAAHAIVAGSRAVLIDLPRPELLGDLDRRGIKPELLLLTHHHRHTADGAAAAARRGIPVRGPKAESDWLSPDGVAKYWRESVPLRNSRTAYLVLAEGIAGVDASLEDGQTIEWQGWKLVIVATPGPSPGHVIVVATQSGDDARKIAFCGDAMAAPGTIWSPFTLEWDHWTDSGLKPAAASLARLAQLELTILCPDHAAPITRDVVAAIRRTQAAVEEVAFLKSFERFSAERLGDAPNYAFLAPDQVASAGEKPWSQVSENLFVTGNTYVLASKTGRTMAIDLWGKRSIDQVQKLVSDRGLAMPEIVWVSHAHYDHFDGIYEMPDRGRFEVWTLGRTAAVLEAPGRFRAPFLDPRPMRVERKFEPGDEAEWLEYRFRAHHLPGQTVFTMGIETTIDGHRSLFTADNFFHMKQFSGSGGWTGLNRALPGGYAASARKILEIAPEWVLAEHGGPFQFDAEDFRRRVAWAESAAAAADRLSPSGDHRRDCDPHQFAIEPHLVTARPGDKVRLKFVTQSRDKSNDTARVLLRGRGHFRDVELKPALAPAAEVTEFSIDLNREIQPGRHVFPARALVGDASLVIDVQ